MSNLVNGAWIIDPWRFVKEQRSIDRTMDAVYFVRLSESVDHFSASVDIRLKGYQDAYRNYILEGQAKTTVQQICQRCLEPFEMILEADFKWIPVHTDEQADELGDDALVIEPTGLDLMKAIEDELLLSLPIIASHPEDVYCEGRAVLLNYVEIETPHPFAALSHLLKKES